jgi:hypothetical protein
MRARHWLRFWRWKLAWARLWIRKDEFHWSLDSDISSMGALTPEEKLWYMNDLLLRRQRAHELDIKREDEP